MDKASFDVATVTAKLQMYAILWFLFEVYQPCLCAKYPTQKKFIMMFEKMYMHNIFNVFGGLIN